MAGLYFCLINLILIKIVQQTSDEGFICPSFSLDYDWLVNNIGEGIDGFDWSRSRSRCIVSKPWVMYLRLNWHLVAYFKSSYFPCHSVLCLFVTVFNLYLSVGLLLKRKYVFTAVQREFLSEANHPDAMLILGRWYFVLDQTFMNLCFINIHITKKFGMSSHFNSGFI